MLLLYQIWTFISSASLLTRSRTRAGRDARIYFAAEIERLKPLEDEGLLCIGSKGLKVKMRGRLLIRNICMAFDSYLHAPLPEGPALARYSRTI